MSVLSISNVNKKFKNRQVLYDIGFEIGSGEICGFVGPNGSGKTTVMKCCMGLLKKFTGEILICGKSIKREFESAIKNISYMADFNPFYDFLSGYINLKLYAGIYESATDEKIKELITFVGMQDRMNDPVKEYSLGMKQRMSLALCLLHEPKIVLMDEPFNGLDPNGVIIMRDFIQREARNNNTAFLISSHNLDEIEKVCSKIFTIKEGHMLGEINMNESESQTVYLRTNDNKRSQEIISKVLGGDHSAADSHFSFIATDEEQNIIIKELLSSNIKIIYFSLKNTLEAEYLHKFGGENIDEA